ncbi:MAG: histidinol-phosphate transaminase [Oscillatoriales cyanobacterium]|nr:MAG: histidinol-phosphate transaminase [Oscillatoriales cyanobacterium]
MSSFIRPDLLTFQAYAANPHDETPSRKLDQLDTNECPYDLPHAVKQQITQTYLDQIQTNRYPDSGHGDLKSAIAGYVNEAAGLDTIGAANISVGNGSDELIRSVLIATCLGRPSSILVASPTFSMYGILAKTLGVNTIEIPRCELDWSIDPERANAAIEQARQEGQPVRAVFVVHPNSPTSNALNATEIAWLETIADDTLVVVDEAYYEFSRQTLVGQLRSNWVITRTFSKALRLAAHRVGYAVALPEIIAIFEKIRLPYNLPSTAQAAALTALSHRQTLLPVIDEILAERDRLATALSSFTALRQWPSDANFLYVRNADETLNLAQLAMDLRSQGTLIRHTGGGLRISIGTPAENARTLANFQTLLKI